ncbi:MAG: mandelate racemase/muconate lactonizing enzyme family protein [Alphaproteobacteria bacterium]|nr:mandelate racemase/muconate lactonizing enzyme family protein [Alphaproteobacteria bacterium]
MKIVDVEALVVRAPGVLGAYGGPYGALVRIATDTGLVGWGEADSLPEVIRAIIEAPYQDELMSGIRPLLLGEDPRDPRALWAKMWKGTSQFGRAGAAVQAMAAADIALWDLASQAAGVPLHRLLGTARRDRVAIYATHPLGATLEETGRFARALRERGFPGVKFGWSPFGRDADQDAAIVATIRAAVGPEIEVLIDGGNVFDVEGAIERCRRFAPHRVFWFEEPLQPEDIAGYARLTRAAATRIAAGELCATASELTRLIREGGIDVVQLDLSRLGVTQAMEVARVAGEAGVPCVNHTYTLNLNLMASLHVLAVVPEISLFEVQGLDNPLRDGLFPDRPRPFGGFLAVPQGPGLGSAPDQETLMRIRVP